MPMLNLIFQGQTLAFTLEKIDRDRLYGYVETETLSSDGEVCSRALLAGDGHTLAGPGDTAVAYLSPDGQWRERSRLRAVDAVTGAALIPVKPTFAQPVDLSDKATTVEDYLSHSIRLVYHLRPDPADGNRVRFHPLLTELEEGAIYKFPFSYRGGDLADVGFLLAGGDSSLFLAVGIPCALAYGQLNQPAMVEEEEDPEEEIDELDFSVL